MPLIFAVSLPQRSCVCSVADRTKYCSASDSSRNQKRCFMLQGTQPGTEPGRLHNGEADGDGQTLSGHRVKHFHGTMLRGSSPTT